MISNMFRHFGWMKTRREGDAGQSLVESALTLPILVLVLLGGAELARVAFAAIEVSNAAKAAVQYGAQATGTAQDIPGMTTAAKDDASDLTLMGATLTMSPAPTISCICANGNASTCIVGDCTGSTIEHVLTVATTATLNPLIHVPGLPTTYTLHGNAVQKILGN